jgi:hypothetical protein
VHAGLAMFEKEASGLEVVQSGDQRQLDYFHLSTRTVGPRLALSVLQLRVTVNGDQARYSFSLDDGRTFQPLGPATPIHFSWWKGSRPALFAYTTQATDPGTTNSSHVDIDWAHYRPLAENPW